MNKYPFFFKLEKTADFTKPIFRATFFVMLVSLSACIKTEKDSVSSQDIDSKMGKSAQVAGGSKLEDSNTGVNLKEKTEGAFVSAGVTLKTATERAELSARVAADKTLDKMDDAAISTAISIELIKDPEIRVFMIGVNTKDGAVTLTGSVPTPALRDRSGAIARTFHGVQSVDNKLSINAR